MEKTATIINEGLKVTDEVPESSYGIPVVVWEEKVYGDNDIIDESGEGFERSVLTGKDAKKTLSETEYKDNPTVFNWIRVGTGLPSFSEYKRTKENIKYKLFK